MNIKCMNKDCLDFNVVRECNVTLLDNEDVYCGICYDPMKETNQPLSSEHERSFERMKEKIAATPPDRLPHLGKEFPDGKRNAKEKTARLAAERAAQADPNNDGGA